LEAFLIKNTTTFNNSILLSNVSNQFWFSLIDYIIQHHNSDHCVFENTGPTLLTRFIKHYIKNNSQIKVVGMTHIHTHKTYVYNNAFQIHRLQSSRWWLNPVPMYKQLKLHVKQYIDIQLMLMFVVGIILFFVIRKWM
jgi:mannosyltransferase OCH1-like enzyme